VIAASSRPKGSCGGQPFNVATAGEHCGSRAHAGHKEKKLFHMRLSLRGADCGARVLD
jgi:hypothetical protein